MKFYPVFLNLRDRKVVVVGGGKVAERKVHTVLRCGAKVLVVSPTLTIRLRALVQKKLVLHRKRSYRSQDLQGASLVLAATNQRRIQETVAHDARRKDLLVNVADRAELCDFLAPSILNRGNLTIAISTGGASPALARKLRQELGQQLGQGYGKLLQWMKAVRGEIIHSASSQSRRRILFNRILNSDVVHLLKQGKTGKAHRLFMGILERSAVPIQRKSLRKRGRRSIQARHKS